MSPISNAGDVPILSEEILRASRAEVLREAREEVEQIVKAGESNKKPPKTLFLELHYPFFSEKVQSILKERPPLANGKAQNDACYAVDAYLWAEQYALIAYNKSWIKDCEWIHDQTYYFFLSDLHWFSRLMSAVASEIEVYAQADYSALNKTHERRLQAWRNRYSSQKQQPSGWLGETRSMADAKLQGLLHILRLLAEPEHKILVKESLKQSKTANARLRDLLRRYLSSVDANQEDPSKTSQDLQNLLRQASLTGHPELQALLVQASELTNGKLPGSSSTNAADQGDAMNSIRATASQINSQRRGILKLWLPSWKAELQRLDTCFPKLKKSSPGSRKLI